MPILGYSHSGSTNGDSSCALAPGGWHRRRYLHYRRGMHLPTLEQPMVASEQH